MPGSRCNCRSTVLAGGRDRRRPVRAAGRRDEPGRRAAVDPLAGLADPGIARGGQRLLHGVPVHAAADAGPPLAPRAAALAATAAEQMAGRGPARPVSLGLRGVLALGQPVVDGLDRRSATSSRPSSIDGLFRGASFCKYVCPIGQFNFVQSLVSPLEVKVRDPDVCHSCRTKDCIRGRDGIPGCELDLFQPRKAGNLDCTFCLDCVHACPHDNIGILAVAPGRDLWHEPHRSGIGRLERAPGPGGPDPGPGLRRVRQRRGDGRPGRRLAGRPDGPAGAARLRWRSRRRTTSSPWSSLPLLTVGLATAIEPALGRAASRPGGSRRRGSPMRWSRSASACGCRTTAFTS